MFREVAISALVVVAAGIILHALTTRRTKADARRVGRPVRRIRAAVAIVLFGCAIGLGITGFYPRLASNQGLSGYLLMTHVTLGGVFAATLAIFAVTWAWDHRFDEQGGDWIRRVCFWLMPVLAVPLVLAVVLNMFPVFGADWQGPLLEIHRSCALAWAVSSVIWCYLTVRMRR